MFKQRLAQMLETTTYEQALAISEPVFHLAIDAENQATKAASPLRDSLELESRVKMAEYGALHKVALLLHPGGWES